ncbi:MAG: peptidoglycan editing factor PgeF [Brevinemataceae bacterium]
MIISIFQDYPEISAGITTSAFGDCSFAAQDRREQLRKQYQFSHLKIPKLEHTDIVLNTNDTLSSPADALICNQKNIMIAVTTADCIPVFLYDSSTVSIGIVHSGRQGLKKKITNKTIEKMIVDFNINIENLKIQIGPHICDKCYELDRELIQEFNIQTNKEKDYLNMQQILINQLSELNISSHQIKTTNLCTHCSTDEYNKSIFYSYRNHNKTERMLSFIGIN